MLLFELSNLSLYYRLTKPGIIYGNAMSAVAGFFIASRWHYDFVIFFAMLFGLSLIIASGCVFNNYLDRDIDARMERTKRRSLVIGTITPRNALLFATLLAIFGSVILLTWTTALTTAVALFGLFMYVIVYSLWCKRSTLHATVIGAIAGAVPPVVGYVAVAHTLDTAALMLFIILMSWQMPHALAIAIRRSKDYRAAGIPVMPVVRSTISAKNQIVAYAFVFLISCVSLSISGFAGQFFLVGMGTLSVVWLIMAMLGYNTKDDDMWAKRIFLFSLIIMTALCVLSALDAAH